MIRLFCIIALGGVPALLFGWLVSLVHFEMGCYVCGLVFGWVVASYVNRPVIVMVQTKGQHD